jgi:hypothetical protein
MCRGLEIEIIAASSPQAKGRVERNHGTHQDRLVKKLRRKQISRLEEMNRYLEEEYCPEHNARFAVTAAAREDYHLPSPGARPLREILRLETERVLNNDWVVRHENRFYQVERQSQHHAPAKSKVTVCEWQDGTMEMHYRGQKLKWKEIEERPVLQGLENEASIREAPRATRRRTWRPGPDHPWRRGYGERNPERLPRPAGAPPSLASPSASP